MLRHAVSPALKTFGAICLLCMVSWLVGTEAASKPKKSKVAAEVAPQDLPPATPRPLPKGPWLVRATDFSKWVISVERLPATTTGETIASPKTKPGKGKKRSNKSNEAGASTLEPNVFKRVTITKTGKIRLETTMDDKGQTVHRWYDGGIQVTLNPEGGDALVAEPDKADGSAYVDYSKSDFPGLEWISPKNYAGVETIKRKECFVFRDKISTLSVKEMAEIKASVPEEAVEAELERFKVAVTAYIDAERRLPVVFEYGDERRSYLFETVPKKVLDVPPEVQIALKLAAENRAISNRPAGQP